LSAVASVFPQTAGFEHRASAVSASVASALQKRLAGHSGASEPAVEWQTQASAFSRLFVVYVHRFVRVHRALIVFPLLPELESQSEFAGHWTASTSIPQMQAALLFVVPSSVHWPARLHRDETVL
jgi:hypothetical protein